MSAAWQASADLLVHCWDSGQPGPSSTEEFTVTLTAPLSMLTGPLCKGEPASQKQAGDFETATLNKLLLKVHCAEPTWNRRWTVRSP